MVPGLLARILGAGGRLFWAQRLLRGGCAACNYLINHGECPFLAICQTILDTSEGKGGRGISDHGLQVLQVAGARFFTGISFAHEPCLLFLPFVTII